MQKLQKDFLGRKIGPNRPFQHRVPPRMSSRFSFNTDLTSSVNACSSPFYRPCERGHGPGA